MAAAVVTTHSEKPIHTSQERFMSACSIIISGQSCFATMYP